jgi:hypothetical protein
MMRFDWTREPKTVQSWKLNGIFTCLSKHSIFDSQKMWPVPVKLGWCRQHCFLEKWKLRKLGEIINKMSCIFNDVMHIVGQVDVMSWLRRCNVMANLACGIPELKVVFWQFLWNRINRSRNTRVMVFGQETPPPAPSETVWFYYLHMIPILLAQVTNERKVYRRQQYASGTSVPSGSSIKFCCW